MWFSEQFIVRHFIFRKKILEAFRAFADDSCLKRWEAWRWHLSCASLAALTLPALAQSIPDAGQILQQQQRAQPRLPERLAAPERAAPVAPLPEPIGVGVQVTVQRVRFSGGEGMLGEAELQSQARELLGRTADMAQLQQFVGGITMLLKQRGWTLARAYLPPQDLTEGTLHVVIQRGRLEGDRSGSGFDIKGENLRLDTARIRATVARAIFADDSDLFDNLRLERGLLLLNELPGISARSTLEKGAEPDTTRLGLQVSEGPRYSGSLQADNQGSRYTGPDRVTLQAYANNPTRVGDKLSLTATMTPLLRLASLGYATPLGNEGLSANLGLTLLGYRLGEELTANQSEGVADTLSLNLSYALERSRNRNLRLQVSAEHKILRDEALGSVVKDRRIDSVGLNVNADHLDSLAGGGMLNGWFTYTRGHADYSRVAADVTGDLAAQSAGNFSKYQFGLVRLQTLTERWSMMGSLTGQRANGNLASSEKFQLGGPSGVRAYPSGEGSGDEGDLVTLELRYDFAGQSDGRQLQLVGFVDSGQITLNKNPWPGSAGNASGSNRYHLKGAGAGLSYAPSDRYNLRVLWSRAIGENPGRGATTNNNSDGKKDRSQLWLLASMRY